MTSILVDSNVWIDVLGSAGPWQVWSAAALRAAADAAVVVINPIIYGEVSIGFSSIEELDVALRHHSIRREQLPYDAAFLAGKCFVDYRRRGGLRTSPLPDFYIGAHAAVAGYTLLTRDAARYRTYLPRLQLIAPG